MIASISYTVLIISSLISNAFGVLVDHTALENATSFALIYAYPIVAYSLVTLPYFSNTSMGIGSNAAYIRRQFYPANTTTPAVRVNTDTLYVTGLTDLSRQNVVFTFPPPQGDRFYSLSYYDFYGNNIVNLASPFNSTPGRYLLRPYSACGNVTDDKSGELFQGYINSPTTYGFFAYRFLIKDKGNSTEFDLVHHMQNESTVEVVPRTHASFADDAPTMSPAALSGAATYANASGILSALARLSPYNPPLMPNDTLRVVSMFEKAGIRNGVYTAPEGLNITAAALGTNESIAAAFNSSEGTRNVGNGWVRAFPDVIGNYSTNYLARAYIGQVLYLALTSDVAMYPAYTRDTVGRNQNLEVAPDEAYLITFSRKPPVTELGFWSVTAYDQNQFLIPNGINVNSVGTASNISYSDGMSVYRGSTADARDGPFELLLQPAGLYPPSNWTSNWLPLPLGGGQFSINLRFYAPGEELLNDDYEYPTLTKIKAKSR